MNNERVDAAAARQRWEYRCEKVEDVAGMEDILNDAGEGCWELVSVLQAETFATAVYKRPRGLFAAKREAQTAAADAKSKPR